MHARQREEISGLIDGELTDIASEKVLSSLYHAEERQSWEVYQHIGEALRETPSVLLSADFTQRMQEKIAAELPHMPHTSPAPYRGAAPQRGVRSYFTGSLSAVKIMLPSVTVAVLLAFVATKTLLQVAPEAAGMADASPSTAHMAVNNMARADTPGNDVSVQRFSPTLYGYMQAMQLPAAAIESDK